MPERKVGGMPKEHFLVFKKSCKNFGFVIAVMTLMIAAFPAQAQAESQSRADLDGDCTLTVSDFLDFQTAFSAREAISDFNEDGRFSISDFLAFLNTFEADQDKDLCPDPDPDPDPTEIQVLHPGSGFGVEREEPQHIGSPDDIAYEAQAIGRWNVVPYQTFDGVFEIGIPAFHTNGIDRVEFSVDGGPWVAVREMVLNPRTNTEEYTVALDASLFADGAVEVRAKIYPNIGLPRYLNGNGEIDIYLHAPRYKHPVDGEEWSGDHALILHANAGGTNGEEVLELPSGTYVWGELLNNPDLEAKRFHEVPRDRWYIVRPDPGADVTITSSSRAYHPQPNMIKLEGLRLTQPGKDAILKGSTDNVLWFDDVHYSGAGMWEEEHDQLSVDHTWVTDSLFEESRIGQAKNFVRNSEFRSIGDDTFNETYMLINTKVTNLGTPPPHLDWHPAVIANPIKHDNRVYYGVDTLTRQKTWAFRMGTQHTSQAAATPEEPAGPYEHNAVAVVNVRSHKVTQGNQIAYVGGQVKHMYFKDSCFSEAGDLSFNFRLTDRVSDPRWEFTPRYKGAFTLENISFQGAAELPWIGTTSQTILDQMVAEDRIIVRQDGFGDPLPFGCGLLD